MFFNQFFNKYKRSIQVHAVKTPNIRVF